MKNLTRDCAVIVTLMALVGCQSGQEGAGEGMAAAMGEPGTPEYKMANAMSAAPEPLASEATIMDWPASEGAEPTVLRAGRDDWICFPDVPDSPANDPMCLDIISVAWIEAWMTRTDPVLSAPGMGYMLQGGSTASNTDPYATEPAPGEDWVREPPHLMLFPSAGMDLSAYPTDPYNGGPWVMWEGTPYEHLMVPVK